MSYFSTKQALVEALINSAIFAADELGFENNVFDPDGKDIYAECYFIPADEVSLGKDASSSDDQRGIFQVSVFVKKNSGNFDNDQLVKIDELRNLFKYGSVLTYNTQKVNILESSLNNGTELESWFRRDLSINYSTFSER